MKHPTNLFLVLALLVASLIAVAYVSRSSHAEARGGDVELISFPRRRGITFRPGETYPEEEQLERYFSRGYELEAVVEDTGPRVPAVLIFSK